MEYSNSQLLQNMFEDGFTYTPGGLFGPTEEFLCRTAPAGQMTSVKGIVIQGQSLIPEINTSESITVSFSGITSPIFSTFNTNNTLIGAVRIAIGEIVDEPKLEFKEVGTARVDSSMIQLASLGFQAECERAQELFESSEDADPAEFFEKLQNSEIPGFTFKKSDETAYSSMSSVNNEVSIDISSGYGDGTYPVIVGTDEKGNVRIVYIDFLLFQRADIIERLVTADTNK